MTNIIPNMWGQINQVMLIAILYKEMLVKVVELERYEYDFNLGQRRHACSLFCTAQYG